jgi:outer membrane protein OmpU
MFIINNNNNKKETTMKNLKKVGLSALAASLVTLSAQAGELTVSGAASMTYENYTVAATEDQHNNKTFTQSNNIYFTGGGELDNGLTVSVSFELDDGSNGSTASTSVWDNHSVTVSSDSLGSFTLAGHGGSSAASALDTTAAGDIWDNFDATAGIASTEVFNGSKAGNNIMKYTLPAMVDGLSASVSYQAGGNTDAGGKSSTAYGLTYTGFEGLTLSYGKGEDNDTPADQRDVTTIAASYSYGPVTVAYTTSENDATTVNTDQELDSYAITYTITENMSVKYGNETFKNKEDAVDPEYTSISASYTSGGMTVSVGQQTAENADGTATDKDVDYTYLGLAFAF